MACGCPVVTSRVSSLPEVVGDAAVLVNPTDPQELAGAMDRVLSDRDLRKSLIQKGLERAKGFSWRAGAEDIVNACLRLVGDRPIPPKTTPRSD
jgi:glycosyltransferase involved in cell wall biosynthesis